MANANAAFGFRPISMLDGSPYNGGTIKCVILGADTTDTFVGDPVALDGTGDAKGLYPSVIQASVGSCFGVIASFDAEPTNLELQYASGGTTTDRLCNVIPAMDVIFAIQEDSDGGDLAVTQIGEYLDYIVAAGSTVTGQSGVELDTSTTTGDSCLILGIYAAPDNELGTNAIWKVRINESTIRGPGTGV